MSLSLKRDHADNGAGVGAGVDVGVGVGAGVGVDAGADNGVDSSLPFQRNVTCQHFLSTFFLLLSFFKKKLNRSYETLGTWQGWLSCNNGQFQRSAV